VGVNRRISLIPALIALALIATWLYVILRAIKVSFVCDEALSFGIIHGDPLFVDTPNNQWLNTLLMRVSQSLFGESELALRLPNVAVFGLYAAASVELLSRVRRLQAKLVGFALLVVNPFLLQFFSLARGYGLSLAFSAAALASIFFAGHAPSARRELARFASVGVFAALAFYANFGALNLALALLAVEIADLLLRGERRETIVRAGYRPAALAIIILSAASLIPGVLHLQHLQAIGQLYDGGHVGFIHDTIGSLLETSTCGYGCAPSWLTTGKTLVVIVAGLAIVWPLGRYLMTRTWSDVQRAASIFALMVLGAVLESHLLGTLYPIDRAALVYVVTFAVLVAFTIDDLAVSMPRWSVRAPLGVAAIAFVALASANFARDANFKYTTIWAYDASSHEVINAILAYERRTGRPSHPWKLISGFPRDEALNYYRIRFKMTWLQPVWREPVSTPGGNLYYVAFTEVQELPSRTTLLATFADTGTELRAAPSQATRRQIDTQSAASPGVTISAKPDPVPGGPGVGKTLITWSAPKFPHAEVRVSWHNGLASVFASGPAGSAPAAFIADGARYVFRIYPSQLSHRALDSIVVTRP
jgi:hypothetical protein